MMFLRVKILPTTGCILLAQLKQADANCMLMILMNMC